VTTPLKRTAEYFEKKFPTRKMVGGRLVFFWQCAYAGAFDGPCVLPGDVWDELRQYGVRDSSSIRKEYFSADVAIADLLQAIK
jgi:hypothetical protein